VLYEVGDIVHYLRTDSIYLLLEIVEGETIPSYHRGDGNVIQGFRPVLWPNLRKARSNQDSLDTP